jgi:hypothetical protein
MLAADKSSIRTWERTTRVKHALLATFYLCLALDLVLSGTSWYMPGRPAGSIHGFWLIGIGMGSVSLSKSPGKEPLMLLMWLGFGQIALGIMAALIPMLGL